MLTNSNGEVQKGGPWQCHHGWAQVLIKYIDYDKCVPVPGNQKGLVSEFHRDLMAKCPLHFSPGGGVWSCLIRSDLSKSSRGQASSVQNMKLFPPKANTPKQRNLHESTNTNTNTNTDAGSKFCDWNIIFWHICYRLGGGSEQRMTMHEEGGEGGICKCWQTIAEEWMGVSSRCQCHHGWALEYWMIISQMAWLGLRILLRLNGQILRRDVKSCLTTV